MSTVEPVAGEVSSIDLIIELYKRDVDRTLLIERLKKTPAQRVEDLQKLYDFAMEMRRAVQRVPVTVEFGALLESSRKDGSTSSSSAEWPRTRTARHADR